MKLVLLVIAMAVASANAQSCQLKKVLYKPVPPSYTLGEDQVNDNIRCPKGSQSLIAEDWTQNFTELGEQLLEKYVFPSLQGDWKDTYDCGQPGIKKVNVKGIAGCLKKKVFHGDIAVEYVCNEQARTRSVVIDGIMQLSGKC